MEMMSEPNCRSAIIYIALAIVMMSMAQKIDAATSCKQCLQIYLKICMQFRLPWQL